MCFSLHSVSRSEETQLQSAVSVQQAPPSPNNPFVAVTSLSLTLSYQVMFYQKLPIPTFPASSLTLPLFLGWLFHCFSISISYLHSIPLSLPQCVPLLPRTGGDSSCWRRAWDRCRLQFQLLLSAERQRPCCSAALKPLHQIGPKVNRAVRRSSKSPWLPSPMDNKENNLRC